MSALTVNGLPVPVADGTAKKGNLAIGAFGRTHNGQAYANTKALKETHSDSTPQVTKEDAAGLTALIEGRGEAWLFEADANGSRGTAPTNDTYTETPRLAAVGNGAIGDEFGSPALKFGRAIQVERIGACLLPVGQKTCESGVATDYWAAAGTGVFAFDTTQALEGVKSLKVTAVVALDGVQALVSVPTTIGEEYTFSAWVYSATAVTVRLQLATATADFLLTPYTWERVAVTFTATATSHSYDVLGVGAGDIFYADNLQIEEAPTATAFMPTASRVQNLVWAPMQLGPRNTLIFWAKGSKTYYGAGQSTLFTLRDEAGSAVLLRLWRQASAELRMSLYNADGSLNAANGTHAWTDGAWHHIAIAITGVDPTWRAQCYADGVPVIDITTNKQSLLSEAARLRIGQASSNAWDGGSLAEFVLIPEALTAAQIAALAAASTGFGELPQVNVAGAFTRGAQCYGMVQDERVAATSVGGTFKETDRVLSFALEEA